MRIVRAINDLNLDRDHSIGLVPTMGAFHDGHLSLMKEARAENDLVAVSLFVNPTQFGPDEDYEAYPRDEARDASLAESAGADILFAPTVDEMYRRRTTTIVPSGVAERWEGERRPGHFMGVATVVMKLFNIVEPTRAYFGLKDFQQCAVVGQMVEDLNMTVGLRFVETIREVDGLALSSRNAYLSPEQRAAAPGLYSELRRLSRVLERAHRESIDAEIGHSKVALEASGFQVDYLEVVDEKTLLPSTTTLGRCRIIAAAFLGKIRLIDNSALCS